MKLTKFAHSCILVETTDRVGLFDPGNYSWNSGTFNIDKLERLDEIMITHEHADHMHLPFIEALLSKFPSANIITTSEAKMQLKSHGIDNAIPEIPSWVNLFSANHESMEPLSPPPPSNTGIHYLDLFTHPGDCHDFNETRSVLAIPITAAWGTTAKAAKLLQELKPKYVIPIHDWLWRDEIRLKFYERLNVFCNNLGIIFLQPIDGEVIEVGAS